MQDKIKETREFIKTTNFTASVIKNRFNSYHVYIKSGASESVHINIYHYKEHIKDPALINLLDGIMSIYNKGIAYTETSDYGTQPNEYIDISFGGWDGNKKIEYIKNNNK